ncbi:MAG: DNA-directed RNA polymerase subunit beta, partial [Zetaproteobacteria bacterium]
MLEVQKQSYREFLYGPDGDPNGGRLARLFADIFPIRDAGGAAELEFLGLEYGAPRFDEEECRRRDLTYAAPLRVHLQLKVFERGERSRTRTVREVRKQVVYFGEIPMMTERGSFIINGTERVIVSQLHRSPGVFFSHDGGKTHASGKLLFNARIIPYRGAWLDFEFDGRDRLFFRIDMRRKLPVGVLLKAFGLSTQEILDRFYARRRYRFNDKGEVELYFDPELFEGARAPADIRVQGRRIVAEGKRITKAAVKRLVDAGVEWIKVPDAAVVGEYAAEPIVVEGGEILVDVNEEITEERLDALRAAGVNEFACLFIDPYKRGPWLADTLKLDQVQSREEAQVEIYRMMRPGEPPTVEAARNLFEGMFFDPARYDLSEVGRMKLNARLGISEDEAPLSLRTLRVEDVLRTIDTLLGLRDGIGEVDDIDHLGNRRVRCVGEQLENQLRTGLVRVERTVRERIATSELESVSPSDLINSKPVIAAIREFFGSNQLSQFMDQTNPLSEITHKRRVSALGPGGLSRERAGFEVRDVHPTHYGRLCPI